MESESTRCFFYFILALKPADANNYLRPECRPHIPSGHLPARHSLTTNIPTIFLTVSLTITLTLIVSLSLK